LVRNMVSREGISIFVLILYTTRCDTIHDLQDL
jgi:hypothetical protein